VSGLIEDFEVEGIMSEGLYIGSIKELHTIFKNFHIRNGRFINIGSEAMQLQNFGEGCIVENHTVINTGCQFPSPFQDNQVGSMQIKAGGGSFKIRNIYIEQGGQPVMNFFAAAPVYSNGMLIQEGAKPGDVVEISNIYCPSAKGNFLYVHSSCNNGTHWLLDNIHAGGVTKRIGEDTGKIPMPYAFLYDVPLAATDQVTIRNITTDNSLPLVGKNPRYTIENHVIVDSIPKAKFVKAMPEGDVFSYYQFYNQVSQGQFYPLAGQPVKYKLGDLVYFDQVGKQRTWFRSDKDQQATSIEPGEGFTPIQWEADYTLLPEVDPKDEIIKGLQKEIDLLNMQLSSAINLNEVFRVKLSDSMIENDALKNKIEQVKQILI
jgi:hypothetical protein